MAGYGHDESRGCTLLGDQAMRGMMALNIAAMKVVLWQSIDQAILK